jgi:hypothetical protein
MRGVIWWGRIFGLVIRLSIYLSAKGWSGRGGEMLYWEGSGMVEVNEKRRQRQILLAREEGIERGRA